MCTSMEESLGVASGLASKEGHKRSRQAGAASHDVVPRLAGPLHVVQQMLQPQLRQAVQLWRCLQQHPAGRQASGIRCEELPASFGFVRNFGLREIVLMELCCSWNVGRSV